jgi:hypothetical protein
VIIESLMQLSLWFNETLAGFAPPADIEAPSAQIDGWSVLLQWVVGAGAWVNVPAMMTLCGIAVSWYLVTITVKLLRVLISHIPLVGGRG